MTIITKMWPQISKFYHKFQNFTTNFKIWLHMLARVSYTKLWRVTHIYQISKFDQKFQNLANKFLHENLQLYPTLAIYLWEPWLPHHKSIGVWITHQNLEYELLTKIWYVKFPTTIWYMWVTHQNFVYESLIKIWQKFA